MQDKRLIHLVDDEEAIRKSAGFMLRTVGFEVRTYASGVEFLKLARTAEGRVRQGGVISAVAVGHRQAALAVMCRG